VERADEMKPYSDSDPLATMRGMVIASIVSLAVWGVIILAVWEAVR